MPNVKSNNLNLMQGALWVQGVWGWESHGLHRQVLEMILESRLHETAKMKL